MGAAEHGVFLGGARAAIRAPILLLRGAIIGAVDLRFSYFYGTETEPDCETIFRARGGYTSSPHIVALLSRDSDSSVVALHVRTVYFLNAPFLDRLASGSTDHKRTPLAAAGADGWSGLRVRWERSIDSACPCFAYAAPRGASSMRM